jgi:hypothetical protein
MVNQRIHTAGRESWKDNSVVAKQISPYFLRLLRSLNLFPGVSSCFVVLTALGIARVDQDTILAKGFIFGYSGKFSHKFVVVEIQPKKPKVRQNDGKSKLQFAVSMLTAGGNLRGMTNCGRCCI